MMCIEQKLIITEIIFAGLFGILSVRTADIKTSDFFSKLMDISLVVAMITFVIMIWNF
jgi:hypothetical protein